MSKLAEDEPSPSDMETGVEDCRANVPPSSKIPKKMAISGTGDAFAQKLLAEKLSRNTVIKESRSQSSSVVQVSFGSSISFSRGKARPHNPYGTSAPSRPSKAAKGPQSTSHHSGQLSYIGRRSRNLHNTD